MGRKSRLRFARLRQQGANPVELVEDRLTTQVKATYQGKTIELSLRSDLPVNIDDDSSIVSGILKSGLTRSQIKRIELMLPIEVKYESTSIIGYALVMPSTTPNLLYAWSSANDEAMTQLVMDNTVSNRLTKALETIISRLFLATQKSQGFARIPLS